MAAGGRYRSAGRRLSPIYCSPHNAGSIEIVQELNSAFPDDLKGLAFTSDISRVADCDRFLVYLTSRTWTSGGPSCELARELARAMRQGVHVLLAHEFPSAIHTRDRAACDFADVRRPLKPSHPSCEPQVCRYL